MTNKEIVRALREECKTCSERLACKNGTNLVGFYCANKDAADLIERLTAENAALRKKQTEAEAERDALLEQIKARRSCLDCKHFDYCEFDNATVIDCMNCVTKNCPCYQCGNSSRWEWRGLPEEPEEGEKA